MSDWGSGECCCSIKPPAVSLAVTWAQPRAHSLTNSASFPSPRWPPGRNSLLVCSCFLLPTLTPTSFARSSAHVWFGRSLTNLSVTNVPHSHKKKKVRHFLRKCRRKRAARRERLSLRYEGVSRGCSRVHARLLRHAPLLAPTIAVFRCRPHVALHCFAARAGSCRTGASTASRGV